MWHEMCKYLVDGQSAKTTKNPIGDPMRCFLFAVLSLAAPLGAFALTWDFADGSTYGWTARESSSYTNKSGSREPLHSEVVDGVWRIAPVPGRRPTVQLRSPLIGKDSALFDRLTLRLRLIHHSPTAGEFSMDWSNAKSRRLLIGGFNTTRLQPYPIEWEDITIELRALATHPEHEITWQDTLFNIRIDMMLYRDSQDVDNHPKFLAIDHIQLTGAEELAQGELSPEDISMEVGPPGTLFAELDFFPLGEGLGIPDRQPDHLPSGRRVGQRESRGAVGDVDGDGDADLVVAWNRLVDGEKQQGWIVASNDGLGRFDPTQEVALLITSFSSYPRPLDLWGSDFDGDGLLDLVVEHGTVELWSSWGGGFDPVLQLGPGGTLVGLADGDGDGDMDLLVRWDNYFRESSDLTLWIDDGYDFVSSDTLVFDREEANPYLPAGQPLGKAASLLWNRPCHDVYALPDEPLGPWQLARPWAAIEEPPLFFAAEVDPCALHLLADLDGNGAVDLLGSPERIDTFFDTDYYGLALWRLDASGVVDTPFLARLESTPVRGHRQRPQRRWTPRCSLGR